MEDLGTINIKVEDDDSGGASRSVARGAAYGEAGAAADFAAMRTRLAALRQSGAAGAGAAGVGGLGGAAIGGAVAGAAIVGIVAAIAKAKRTIEEWGVEVQRSARNLAPFSGAVAAAGARSMVAGVQRGIAAGASIGGAVAGAVDSKTRLDNAMAPLENAFTAFKSIIVTDFNNVMVGVVIPTLKSFAEIVAQAGKTVALGLTAIIQSITTTIAGVLDSLGFGGLAQGAVIGAGMAAQARLDALAKACDAMLDTLRRAEDKRTISSTNALFEVDLRRMTGGRVR